LLGQTQHLRPHYGARVVRRGLLAGRVRRRQLANHRPMQLGALRLAELTPQQLILLFLGL
jgi:hypothetical protein